MVSQTDESIENTYMEDTMMEIMMNKINIQNTVKRLSYLEKITYKHFG